MTHLRWLDIFIVGAYILGLTAIGLRFSRKQTTTDHYFMAKRSIPSWAMGMSFMATLVTSLTFVSYPGAAYGKDWSLLVPGLLVIGVLGLVGGVQERVYGATENNDVNRKQEEHDRNGDPADLPKEVGDHIVYEHIAMREIFCDLYPNSSPIQFLVQAYA